MSLEILDLHISKRGKKILRGIDLNIGTKPIVVLGPNGAGKSTLFRAMVGLETSTDGNITIDGIKVSTKLGSRRQRSDIGYLSQTPDDSANFTGITAIEYAGWLKGLSGEQLKTAVTEAVSLSRATEFADRKTAKLSGGQLKRIGIAQAIVHSPALVILDEPTAGVDVALRQGLWQFIRRLNRDGHTIILTTHYLEEAEALCGRVALMRSGQICALERTETLIRQFAKHRLTVRLADGGHLLPAVLMAQAKPLPEAPRTWLWTLDQLSEIESVLASLRESGCKLEDMSITPPDLETAFLSFMNDGAGKGERRD